MTCSTPSVALGVFAICILISSGLLVVGSYGKSGQPSLHHNNISSGGTISENKRINATNSLTNPTLALSSSGHSSSNSPGAPNKIVMLTFDDNRIGDTTYAKPILDKYGFKATFFVICNKTTDKGAMHWNDIADMKKDGMDIESHTMTHHHLSTMSQQQLEYQIGGSKQCLASHGYNATIFAYPYDDGSENKTVVDTVARYYNIARSGFEPLMFLDCKGFHNSTQTDCKTFTSTGKLNYANRYAIRGYTENLLEQRDLFNPVKIMADFSKVLNSQLSYNSNGTIRAIPILVYHSVGLQSGKPFSTEVGLFGQEMKYLHDNGFKVVDMADLGYNNSTNTFYLKNS